MFLKKLNALNGWNRLFVLFAVLWILQSAYFFYNEVEPRSDYVTDSELAEYMQQTLYKGTDKTVNSDLHYPIKITVRFGLNADAPKGEIIWKDKNGVCENKSFVMKGNTEISTECKFGLEEVTKAYKIFADKKGNEAMINYSIEVAKKVALTSLQLLLAYLVMYSIAWVVKGFRKCS